MVGSVNESLVYPIIDLIHRELRRHALNQGYYSSDKDFFDDIPSVRLYREHELSDAIVTRVEMNYHNEPFSIKIFLLYGGMGSPYVLDSLLVVGFFHRNEWTSEEVVRYQIFLNRNEKGVLTGIDVVSSTGIEETP